MWLLKAVGVHDQHREYTFALERGRSYTIGREKGCDIQFSSKRLRNHEGSLEVGDWSLTEPNTKPTVKYKVESKKGKKEYPPYTCLFVSNEDDIGSMNLEEYEKVVMQDGVQGMFLSENVGQGVYYADEAWFTLIWKDMYIVWDKMKDETDELKESLKSYCIAWTPSFETTNIPNYVISSTFKANQECNYAVCYSIRILQPTFLRDMVRNLINCWKTRADSQDSFRIPDEESQEYIPSFDNGLQTYRQGLDAWLPDERRPTLFKGWKVLLLRSKATPTERRYLQAVGADLYDLDVTTQPLLSAADFEQRISSWLKQVDEHEGGREKAVVAYFGTVKKNVIDSGKDFATTVEAPCQRLGIYVTPGSIIWHAIRHGGVRNYIAASGAGATRNTEAATRETRPTQVSETAAAIVSETRSLTPPPPETNAPTQPSPSQRKPAIVQETEPVQVQTSTDIDMDSAPPSAQPPSTARRTLKRRAGKPMIDLYVESIAESEPPNGQGGSLGSDPKSQETMTQPPSAQPAASQSYVPDSMMPSQTQSGTSRSRLKRRAGTHQPIVDYTIPGHSMLPSTQDMDPEIKQVYDQAMSSRADRPSLPKRARLASVDEGPSREQTPMDTQNGMDLDENGEEQLDFVEKTLKQAAKAKKEGRQASHTLMPPPSEVPSRTKTRRGARSPSEETEPLEPPRQNRKTSPVKKGTQTQTQAQSKKTQTIPPSTQDTAFLTAIAKNVKSKKAVDELDKEFNQLRIPKPGANPGSHVVKASAWDANHPDWNLVNEFDDDMRGNFIQIVRMDLMRKDGGRRVASTADDGKPNFKKFKKKEIPRREPVRMVLAAPSINDAEMGEPYWPTQQAGGKKGKGKTQTSLTQQMDEDEDEDMPLLPRSRRRLLDKGEQDELSPPPPPSSRVRGTKAAPSQTPAASQAPPRRATQRQLRETSVVSDTSSIGTTGRSTRTTRAAPSTQTRKGRTPAIVIEESEDEVNMDLGPTRSSTGTARGKSGKSTIGVSGTGTGSGFGDDEASSVVTATRGKTQSSLGTGTGRRRLVVDDDDDGELGAAKKRRL